MSKSLLLEIPPDLVHSRIPNVVSALHKRKQSKEAIIGTFVRLLPSPTVQLEDVSYTNSCNQRVRNLRVLVLLYS